MRTGLEELLHELHAPEQALTHTATEQLCDTCCAKFLARGSLRELSHMLTLEV